MRREILKRAMYKLSVILTNTNKDNIFIRLLSCNQEK